MGHERVDKLISFLFGRPTEVDVEAYDGRPSVRALAFISPPDLLIQEGMPPSDRCVFHHTFPRLMCGN